MAERTSRRVWAMRLAYFGLGLLIVFFHLLPLQIGPRQIAGPDLLVALTFAWAVRRPDYVPPLAIAGMMLLADLLLQRPPGLWALLVLLAAEWLKSRDRRLRDGGFAQEWILVSVVLLAASVLYILVLGLLIVANGTLVLAAMQFALTVLAYPLVVIASRLVFGLRRPGPGDFDAMGRSL